MSDSADKITKMIDRIKELPIHQQRDLLLKLEDYNTARGLELARSKFIDFVRRLWGEGFIEGRHHRAMAKIMDGIIRRELKRVCINLGPRHTKSKFGSIYLPAAYFGHHPTHQIMQLGNTQELVSTFGREVRNIVGSAEYQEIFPNVSVSEDSRAADRWNTNQGGSYLARGIGGTVTGRGADLQIIDDAHSEQEAALAVHNPKVFDATYDWYLAGPRQRLQPGGAILIPMTRWGKRDIQGRIISEAQMNGSIDEWKIFEFPAVMPATEGHPDGVPLWPEFWSLEELLAVKRDLPIGRWLAQYLQTPTTDEGAVVKREWWKEWEQSKLPEFIYKVQSWDTAFTAKTHSDYSACTTWGVFYHEDVKGRRVAQVMLIDSWRDRCEFPDLKQQAKEQNIRHRPDTIIIEARSSGPSLIQELRSMGIMVEDNTPSRGAKGQSNDKLARLNAVSDLFKSGFVWYNSTKANQETIEEFAEFPAGDHDDLVDSGTQALQRLRNSMFIGSSSDEYQLYEDDDNKRRERRPSRRLY